MEDSELSLEDSFGAALLAGLTEVNLTDVVEQAPLLRELLTPLDPAKTAATFGGLLTVPELQANALRLEALAHLSLAFGSGRATPNSVQVKQAFELIGDSVCGLFEDPSEDIFVSNIETSRGNRRIVIGLSESADFALQRFVNILEDMPRSEGYDRIRRSVHALLSLSEAICARAGVRRYQTGAEAPLDALASKLARNANTLRSRVHFTPRQLQALAIEPQDLLPFSLPPKSVGDLLGQTLGHTSLERRSLWITANGLSALLPTTFSTAIRRFIIETLQSAEMTDRLKRALAHEFAKTLSSTPLLGDSFGAPIQFGTRGGVSYAAFGREIDPGRYLNFVLFGDSLVGFENDGLLGMDPKSEEISLSLRELASESQAQMDAEENFVDGVTLLVSCGIGRPVLVPIDEDLERPGWKLQFISAADLCTLSWVSGFSPLTLWRILSATERVGSLGVSLQNVNGLLNLVAWSRELRGHLVPHGQLPDSFRQPESPQSSLLVIDQNALLQLRHEVAEGWDRHVEKKPDGDWVSVRRFSPGHEVKVHGNYYAFVPTDRSSPIGLMLTSTRSWWCEVNSATIKDRHALYERWRMIGVWIQRAAPILEDHLSGMPDGPISVEVIFDGKGAPSFEERLPKVVETPPQIEVATLPERRLVQLKTTPEFDTALFNPTNIAEAALVRALVSGVEALCDGNLGNEKLDEITSLIVPNNQARQMHAFRARSFRDFVREVIPSQPVLLDTYDDADVRLGLGWSTGRPEDQPEIRGTTGCTAYLNELVKKTENSLVLDLTEFQRTKMIRCLVENYESASVNQDLWNRTAAAVLSLAPDYEASLQEIVSKQSDLSGVFLSTRILIEMAICACPESSGRQPGSLDLSRLMAKVINIYWMGGMSDAIRWGLMEPHLRVTPLGDVHGNFDFVQDIVAPFLKETTSSKVISEADSYAQHFEEPTITPSIDSRIEGLFVEAWQEHSGVKLDEMRAFVDATENLAIKDQTPILCENKSKLSARLVSESSLSSTTIENSLSFLTLTTRDSWRVPPVGYDARDIQPWRFRRRLSVLQRPILQTDATEDPNLILSPGMVRDAFSYMVSKAYEGDFPDWHLSKKLLSWASKVRGEKGSKFVKRAETRLLELGWEVETEITVTKILRMGLDRDYGDVDILAWRPDFRRVLAIECKDVQFRKTLGEISEQLSDFRGEIGSKGKPDQLKRHLSRVSILESHRTEVARYLGAESIPEIEGHLLFSNPVPMSFARKQISRQIAVNVFLELESI